MPRSSRGKVASCEWGARGLNDTVRILKYEEFAKYTEDLILSGRYRAGDRLPSVRAAGVERGIAYSTVLQAYRLLEDRGIVEARPQSGYYVKTRPGTKAPEPDYVTGTGEPRSVEIDDISLDLVRDTLNPGFAQFGAALPDEALLPTAQLNRIIGELIREGRTRQAPARSVQGLEELRCQIARRASSYGCSIHPDEIIVTAGCTEALSLCLRAVCEPGDLVAVESPTYFGILLALAAQNLRAVEVPTHPRTGMDLAALRVIVAQHPVKAVVAVTNFSNPTGSLMSDQDKRDLVATLAEREIPLIEDDISGELYFSESRPSVAKAFDERGLVLLCSSFSKDISTGFRVGWTAPGRFFRTVRRLKYAFNIGTSSLPQLAIARFLETGGYDHLLKRIRRTYASRARDMARSIAAHFPEGTQVSDPRGGFVLWVRLPGMVDSMRLYREAIESFVTIAPGRIFSPSGRFEDCLRLNASCWSERQVPDVVRLGGVAKRVVQEHARHRAERSIHPGCAPYPA